MIDRVVAMVKEQKEFSGGYHAGSHLSCVTQFNLVYFLLVSGYHFVGVTRIVKCLVTGAVVVCIFMYAPIVSKQKRLSEEEIHSHRKWARIKILILSGVWLAGEFVHCNTYTDFVFLAICMLEITLILGKIVEAKEKECK
ncbi:MAG: accessory gene regulator B family protein [Clostridiales bacterium]|nr:accessory gene regulator B family protein [Clostridiales bacterium]